MPAITAMPTLEEQVAAAIEAYRGVIIHSALLPRAQFMNDAASDPGDIAGEVVDLASDRLGYVIDYNWDLPHTLRDQLYRNAWDWARQMDEAKLHAPYTASAVAL